MRVALGRGRGVVALGTVLACTLLVGYPCAFALNPALDINQYAHTAWKIRDGFAKGTINPGRIEVEVHYDQRQLRLRVWDNGKGIDEKILSGGGRPGHYGLAGMYERAKLVGGKLAVWSELDSGAEVELAIPAAVAYAKWPIARRSMSSG